MNRIRYAALVLLIAFVVPMSSAQELRSVMLRHPRVDVQKHYDLLAVLNVPDQKAFYRTLPVGLQEDLWTLHGGTTLCHL